MSTSRKIRMLSMLLCLLLALTMVLGACSDDQQQGDPTSEPTTADNKGNGPDDGMKEATIEDWLPITDYGVDGGAGEVNYLIFNNYNYNYMLTQQEESADPLRAAAYSRTQLVQETFNVVFNVIESGDCTAALRSSLAGSGGDYDLVYPHPGQITSMMVENLSTNYYTCENIHLDQPWWNSSVETFTIDGRLFFAAADYTITGQGLVGMIYNRPLWEDLQLDYDLAGLVKNKKWTMSKLREIAMKYGKDANDDNVYDLKDYYGMIYQNYHNNAYYWSMGGKVVKYDSANNEYQLAVDTNLVDQMANALQDLVYDSDNKVFRMENVSWSAFGSSAGWTAYKNGNSLFMSYEIGALFKHLNEVPFELGYLPLPKLNEDPNQGYPALCGAGFVILPRKSGNIERNSVVLEALAIDSYARFRTVFFNTILLGRMAEQPVDYEMLVLMHESKVYDLGYNWSAGGAGYLMDEALTHPNASMASYIKRHWNEFKGTLDKIEEIRGGTYDD